LEHPEAPAVIGAMSIFRGVEAMSVAGDSGNCQSVAMANPPVRETPEIPAPAPGTPTAPPPESPPGNPRPEVPPPQNDPAQPPQPPQEFPGNPPNELPMRGPQGPDAPDNPGTATQLNGRIVLARGDLMAHNRAFHRRNLTYVHLRCYDSSQHAKYFSRFSLRHNPA
jgi:hypothetical protein